MRKLFGICLAFAMLVGPALAQGAYGERGGEVFLVETNTNTIYRIDDQGNASTIGESASHIRRSFDGNYVAVDAGATSIRLFGFDGDSYGFTSLSIVDATTRGSDFNGNYSFIVLDQSGPAIIATQLNGVPTTVHAGAPLQAPQAFVSDAFGGMWIADSGVGAILYRSPAGVFSTFASGPWSGSLVDIARDHHGNIITVGSAGGVYRINQFGNLTTVYNNAPLNGPTGICVRASGDYIVTDSSSGSVYSVTPTGTLATLSTIFISPAAPVETTASFGAWTIDQTAPGFVRGARRFNSFDTILSGGPWSNAAPDAILAARGHDFVLAANDSLFALSSSGGFTTLHLGYPLSNLNDLAQHSNGAYLAAATIGSNGVIWQLNGQGNLSTFYDGSQMHGGAVQSANGIEVGPFGEVYISDGSQNRIWRLSSDGATLSTFYNGAPLSSPGDLGWSRQGLFVSSTGNNWLYSLDSSGNLTSVSFTTNPMSSVSGSWTGNLYTLEPNATGGSIRRWSTDGFGYSSRSASSTLAAGVTVHTPWFEEGDLVVTTDDGLIALQHRWGLDEIVSLNGEEIATAITNGAGHQDFAVTIYDSTTQYPASLVLMTPRGHMPIHSGAPLESPTDVVRDENGAFVVTDRGQTDALYRFAPDGSLETLHAGAPFVEPWSVTVDVDTGDYVVADFGAGSLFRVTRSGQVTTISSAIPSVRSVVHDPWDGSFIVGSYGVLRRVTRNGTISTIAGGLQLVTDITFTGDHNLVVTEFGFPLGGGINLYSSTGTLLGSTTTEYDERPWSVAIAHRDKLRGMGTGEVGRDYQLLLDVPGDAGLAYAVLASFTLRPRIPMQGRALVLFPDALTAASQALPTIFRRFTGTLDGVGSANPTIAMPNDSNLVGIRIYVSGFTTEVGYGNSGIRTIFNTVGLTIR